MPSLFGFISNASLNTPGRLAFHNQWAFSLPLPKLPALEAGLLALEAGHLTCLVDLATANFPGRSKKFRVQPPRRKIHATYSWPFPLCIGQPLTTPRPSTLSTIAWSRRSPPANLILVPSPQFPVQPSWLCVAIFVFVADLSSRFTEVWRALPLPWIEDVAAPESSRAYDMIANIDYFITFALSQSSTCSAGEKIRIKPPLLYLYTVWWQLAQGATLSVFSALFFSVQVLRFGAPVVYDFFHVCIM